MGDDQKAILAARVMNMIARGFQSLIIARVLDPPSTGEADSAICSHAILDNMEDSVWAEDSEWKLDYVYIVLLWAGSHREPKILNRDPAILRLFL